MRVRLTHDAGEYDAAVSAFLEADPVGNTVALSALDTLRRGSDFGSGDAWFGWATGDDGNVAGAVFRTPPFHVGVPRMPDAAARALGEVCADRDLPGAVGAAESVAAFAAGADRDVEVHMTEHQYVLHDLVRPRGVPGRPRDYGHDDAEVYRHWMQAFVAETGVIGPADPMASLRSRLDGGGTLALWCVDEEPVAMASRSPLLAGVPRIGPVWTSPEHRGRGYAAAVTAHVCAEAFAAGAIACTLFADAANPTSIRVYERLGFRMVGTIIDARLTR